MQIVWTRLALSDLAAIEAYIARHDPAAARWMTKRIVEAVKRLPARPNIGRPGRVAGTRELVITRTSYIVPYEVTGQEIEILRVYHGARRWPDRF